MLTLSQLERYWIKYGDTNQGYLSAVSQFDKNAIYSCGEYSTTNNAVIRKFGIDGECKWIRELGNNTNRTGSFSIDTDSFGNVYVSSTTYYETDRDFIISKYNSSGVLQWKKKLDAIGSNGNVALKVSASNYIYVCGWTNQSGEGDSDMLVMKLDSLSNIIWQKTIGLSGTEESSNLTLDSNENVIISAYNLDDIIILKYNSSGTLQWQRKFGNVKTGTFDAEYPLGLSVDSNDNIYFTGSEIEEFRSVFGSTAYRYHGIIAKYNPSGTLQWQKKVTTSEQFVYVQLFGITVDSNDNVYIVGGCSITISNSIKYPAYISKLDASGNVIWQRGLYRASSSNVQFALQNFGYNILIDEYGDLCICGSTNYSNDGIYDRTWPLIFKVPSDGSLVSRYDPFIYTSVTLTYSGGTYAESEATFVENTSIFTFTDSTLTDSASSCSYDNLIEIPDDGTSTSLTIEIEDTIPTNGLILHLDAANRNSYPGSGTTWYDLSGNNNATLINGPTYSDDNGGSIVFDGDNDYAITPIATTYQNFTLNCFFYNTSSSKIFRNLISKISYFAAEIDDFPVSLSLNDSGTQITTTISSGTSFSITDPSTGSRLSASLGSLNTWYYVSTTYDKQNLKLYLNGQLVASTPNTISLANNARLWTIGRAAVEIGGGGAQTQYNGNISQVSIYNRALTSEEIENIYNQRYSSGNNFVISSDGFS